MVHALQGTYARLEARVRLKRHVLLVFTLKPEHIFALNAPMGSFVQALIQQALHRALLVPFAHQEQPLDV